MLKYFGALFLRVRKREKQKGKKPKMKAKRLAMASSRMLIALLAVVMLFSFAASSLGTAVAAEAGVYKLNNSIYTDYKSYLDGSVVQKLPSSLRVLRTSR